MADSTTLSRYVLRGDPRLTSKHTAKNQRKP